MLTFMLLALLAAFLRLFECCCSTGLMLLLAAAAVTAFFLELYVLRMTATFSFMLSMYSFFEELLANRAASKFLAWILILSAVSELPPFRVLMSMSTWSRPLTFFARSALDGVLVVDGSRRHSRLKEVSVLSSILEYGTIRNDTMRKWQKIDKDVAAQVCSNVADVLLSKPN